MGIKAADMGIDLNGASIQIQKHMLSEPRRIGKIDVLLNFPASIMLLEKDKIILQRVGDNCPVQKSIHPSIETVVEYKWE
jgi:uncharacterized OsmC-like protein